MRHFARNWHLWLTAGAVIVSEAVWEQLRRLDDCPFVDPEPVDSPPGQGIGVNMPTAGGLHAPPRPQLIERPSIAKYLTTTSTNGKRS